MNGSQYSGISPDSQAKPCTEYKLCSEEWGSGGMNKKYTTLNIMQIKKYISTEICKSMQS